MATLVARAGVGPSERPRAELAVEGEAGGVEVGDLRRTLPVPQLANIVVRRNLRELRGVPAEEDVSVGLDQPLAFDDATPMVAVAAGPGVRLQNRRLRFLRLQEQGVLVVSTDQQDDPGSGAHAADPDDLVGDVHNPVLLDQVTTVRLQRADVVAQQAFHPLVEVQAEVREVQLAHRDDHRRVVDDPEATVDPFGQLPLRCHAVAGVGPADAAAQ